MTDRAPERQTTKSLSAQVAELKCRVAQLDQALASSRIVSTAVGLVMNMYHLNRERAFGYLRRLSQADNVKLRLVAAKLIKDAEHTADNSPSREDPP